MSSQKGRGKYGIVRAELASASDTSEALNLSLLLRFLDILPELQVLGTEF